MAAVKLLEILDLSKYRSFGSDLIRAAPHEHVPAARRRGSLEMSWHQHDRSPPKSSLVSCRIEHGYLAVIFTWRELLRDNAETERHRLKADLQPVFRQHRLGFENFGLRAIETHKCDKGLNVGGVRLVGLEVDVHGAGFTEHAGHARNHFLAVLHQGVDGLSFIFVLQRVIESIAEFDLLATQHD